MADQRDLHAAREDAARPDAAREDEAGGMLKKILSPAEAQTLVPPPAHTYPTSPAKAALPGPAGVKSARSGLSKHFAEGAPRSPAPPNRRGDPHYVKVLSKGQVGYLPKANLPRAREIDSTLQVLGED